MELAGETVADLLATSCAGAAVAVAGGSFLRSDATPTSDLDLVVLFPRLQAAWRETLLVRGATVEVFAKDPSALAFICSEVDGPAGTAPVAEMVAHGTNLMPDHALAGQARCFARAFLEAGPPRLTGEGLAMRRYAITPLPEDLADARLPDEALVVVATLRAEIADLALRGAGRWSGKGKHPARRLRLHDGAAWPRARRRPAHGRARGRRR